jgi:HAD superfamily hydrolase (TIGR01549 family)
LHDTVVYPGIADMLLELSDRGILLAVFTGATRRAAEMQLEHSSLAGLFDVVVGSDEIAAVKPDPAGLVRACELLGVDPGSAAYVGDASNDLRCARAAGATAVAARWGHLFEPGIEADYVATSPADLRRLLE